MQIPHSSKSALWSMAFPLKKELLSILISTTCCNLILMSFGIGSVSRWSHLEHFISCELWLFIEISARYLMMMVGRIIPVHWNHNRMPLHIIVCIDVFRYSSVSIVNRENALLIKLYIYDGRSLRVKFVNIVFLTVVVHETGHKKSIRNICVWYLFILNIYGPCWSFI
jgi:hypothetical protein